jgi:predicted chitinase
MADPIESTPIPDTPPSGSGATKDAMRGIAAIKAACDAGGLTSKYAKCSLLGIIGVESKWVPVEEIHKYSYKNLKSKPRVSEEDAIKYSYDKGAGVSKQEFFGWFYGTRNGKAPAAGQYYGRGFVQLTWKENYAALGKLTGYDLVNDPSLMVGTTDQAMEVCAKVAVEFIKMRIPDWKSEQWKPGFIFKAMHAVNPGDPTGSSSHQLKLSYYEYFLGGKAAPAPSDKDAANTTVNKSKSEINSAPPAKREAYTEDRTSNFSDYGFCDPEGKYPLRDYMNEPDTNRLARGIIDGTHIKFKDSTRKLNIPTANGGYYDQPQSAYNTVYPYNKVMESESGHVLEFDDSPDGERVNLYHRKGTFIEIDPNGTQVNYIVGDGFWITERNGNIFINGTANLTVSGPMNILCQGDANLEVKGQVDAVFHNDANIGVAMDLNVAVGGDYNVLVEGNYNIEVGKTMNTRTIGTMSLESTDALKLKTAKSMSLEGGDTQSTAETLMKMSSAIRYETSDAFEIKAKSFKVEVEETAEIKSKTTQIDTSEKLILNASGNLEAKGQQIQLNSGESYTPITPIDNLGEPKKPVDFAGNEIDGREKENVLVDTVLNPAGEYNPNTLPKNVIDSVLGDIPLSSDALSTFGGSTPNVYDLKYSGPVENKTSLAAANSASSHRLVVPKPEAAYNQPFKNLTPPARHTDAVYKYEEESDWLTASGQKAKKEMTSTSDYEHNGGVPSEPSESYSGTGGSSSVSNVPSDKLNEINNSEEFPANFKLSDNFTLGMLVHQQGHILQNTTLPDGQYTKQKLVANLSALAINILEPIYKELGPCKQQGSGIWQITSGLRNEKTGSDHNKGCAVDIQLTTRDINQQYDLCKKLEKLLPYHKILFEYRNNGTSNWIHISYVSEGRMKLCSTMIDDKIVDSKGSITHGSTGINLFYV